MQQVNELHSKSLRLDKNHGVIDFSTSDKLPRKRAVLTEQEATAIFGLRGSIHGIGNFSRDRDFTSRSSVVSKMFGVSPKAVRDIWNMRTWRHCTQTLWADGDHIKHAEFVRSQGNGDAAHATYRHTSASEATKILRSVGRPRGSKDSQPRKPRQRQSLNAIKHSEHQTFHTNHFYCTTTCGDMAAVDSDASTISQTVQENNGRWTSDATTPASSPDYSGFGLSEDDDLSRTFPFFLEI